MWVRAPSPRTTTVPNKWQTVIEDGASIGSHNVLVAPIRIGKDATTGAGSTITKDAPDGQLTLARSKQSHARGLETAGEEAQDLIQVAMPLAQFVAFHAVAEPTRETLPMPAFAVMIARSADGIVLVFNRYRKVWELPGGFIDSGETPRQAAERELPEEAGCARDIRAGWASWKSSDGKPHFGAVFRCEATRCRRNSRTRRSRASRRRARGPAPTTAGPFRRGTAGRFG